MKRNPVNDLFRDSAKANISRRDVFKRAGALGLSAGLAATIFNKYGTGVYAQDQEPGYTLVVPEGLRTDLSGTSLNVIQGAEGRPEHAWEIAAAAAFSEATGIETTVQAGPESATDRLTS